jgi:hypothetical protein
MQAKYRRKWTAAKETQCPSRWQRVEQNTCTLTDPTSFHFLLKHKNRRDSSAYIVSLTLKSRDFIVRFSEKESLLKF